MALKIVQIWECWETDCGSASRDGRSSEVIVRATTRLIPTVTPEYPVRFCFGGKMFVLKIMIFPKDGSSYWQGAAP